MAELRVLIVCFCFLFYFRGSRLWLRAACTTRFAHSMHASTFADSLLAAATETFTKLACVCVCAMTHLSLIGRLSRVSKLVRTQWEPEDGVQWTWGLGPGEIPVAVVGSRWHIQACASWGCLERQGGGTSFLHAMEAAHKIGGAFLALHLFDKSAAKSRARAGFSPMWCDSYAWRKCLCLRTAMLNDHAANANERFDPSALQEVADLKPAHATAYGFCGFDFPCPVGWQSMRGFG